MTTRLAALPEPVWTLLCRYLLLAEDGGTPQQHHPHRDLYRVACCNKALRHVLGAAHYAFLTRRVAPVSVRFDDLMRATATATATTTSTGAAVAATADSTQQAAAAEAARARVASAIAQGFGHGADALGLLLVTGVPEYPDLYARMARHMYALAVDVPLQVKRDTLSAPAGTYGAGWQGGRDARKHNFRCNPLVDKPADAQVTAAPAGTNDSKALASKRDALVRDCADWYTPNKWPAPAHVGGYDFKRDIESLGRTVHDTTVRVARACDAYVQSVHAAAANKAGDSSTSASSRSSSPARLLSHRIELSYAHVCRLLFYGQPPTPPPSGAAAAAASGVQGPAKVGGELLEWHNDHGALTALGAVVYLAPEPTTSPASTQTAKRPAPMTTTPMRILSAAPDPRAGIYVAPPRACGGSANKTGGPTATAHHSRAGVVHVVVPPDALCLQIGESAQIWSGGVLRAGVHMVRGPTDDVSSGGGMRGVSHVNLYYFTHPVPDAVLKPDDGAAAAAGVVVVDTTPFIAPLSTRWTNGQTFRDFALAQQKNYKA